MRYNIMIYIKNRIGSSSSNSSSNGGSSSGGSNSGGSNSGSSFSPIIGKTAISTLILNV